MFDRLHLVLRSMTIPSPLPTRAGAPVGQLAHAAQRHLGGE
jgi:hypothetical protein